VARDIRHFLGKIVDAVVQSLVDLGRLEYRNRRGRILLRPGDLLAGYGDFRQYGLFGPRRW
jgi:hypothetical protein